MEVARKVAVVTGAGGGIGAAIARRLVRAGASVLASDLDAAAALAVTEDIAAGFPAGRLPPGLMPPTKPRSEAC